ncbi:GNAT family N-acetyltransferase [Sneathiella sp. P13V-1]|uniref:bifunctional helix-turn-helix transcriptional regulator/GNAT family N-acetyltransferase n=1 Tax=Sneathiella sp. P13V-1 TaxID=2697366 RepID=UPI00187B8131|nr:bifunctional helix-turn-helix transcriptional regulator/GNAT family N-acetyltransferase [Sneathiella sp. P13V-1]MBE7638224.1 GNAT family N-acetyltransferase [Sneathiella sp. P13V-1]
MKSSDTKKFREFNRFHTRLVGALNEGLLNSRYTLQQLRLLYEVASAPAGQAPSARDLGEYLQVDPGYMSRLVSKLEKDDLIQRTPSIPNAKRLELTLTEEGREFFAEMEAASDQEVEELLAPLSQSNRQEIIAAMFKIRRLLGDSQIDNFIVLRDPNPGDLSFLASQQTRYFSDKYGWTSDLEADLSLAVSNFIKTFDPKRERCWIAERGEEMAGAVVVAMRDKETALIRQLFVEPGSRKVGLGRKLLMEAIRFSRSKKYRTVQIQILSALKEAQDLCEGHGFQLIGTDPHESYGEELALETWELIL